MCIITIRELSEKSGINYSTCRKYMSALKDRNAINELSEEWVDVFKDIYSYTRARYTLEESIDMALGKERNISDSEKIEELTKRIDELEKGNSMFLMMFSNKLDSMQRALPSPDEKIKNYEEIEEIKKLNSEILAKYEEIEEIKKLNSEILAKVDNVQKALPAPNEGLWKSFLRMLGIRRKNNKQGS